MTVCSQLLTCVGAGLAPCSPHVAQHTSSSCFDYFSRRPVQYYLGTHYSIEEAVEAQERKKAAINARSSAAASRGRAARRPRVSGGQVAGRASGRLAEARHPPAKRRRDKRSEASSDESDSDSDSVSGTGSEDDSSSLGSGARAAPRRSVAARGGDQHRRRRSLGHAASALLHGGSTLVHGHAFGIRPVPRSRGRVAYEVRLTINGERVSDAVRISGQVEDTLPLLYATTTALCHPLTLTLCEALRRPC